MGWERRYNKKEQKKMSMKIPSAFDFLNCCKKKLIHRNLNWTELGKQKGALSCSETTAEPTGRRKTPFLTRTQPMKSHGLFVYYSPPNFLFLSVKASSFLCCGGDLNKACHGFRPRIAILCWSQVNLPFLEKYLWVYFRSTLSIKEK